MKSVMFTAIRTAETVDVAEPSISLPGEAIVQVERTAICGSDLHPYRGEWGDPSGERPGHEFLGTVVAVGADVAHRLGQRVLVSGAVGCGRCPSCGHGISSACSSMKVLGIPAMSPYPGGQAELVVVPDADTALLAIPEGVSDEAAILLTDNLATGWQGARRAGVAEGHTVAVVGFGPVGMCAAMAARALGAWEVLVVDPIASRRAFAEELGAVALDADQHTVDAVVERTAGGTDAVIETAGRDAAVRSAIAMAHASARIASVSVPSEPYSQPPEAQLLDTQRYLPTVASPQRAWPQLLDRLDDPAFAHLDDIFSHRFALADATAAYELFDRHPDTCRKVPFDL